MAFQFVDNSNIDRKTRRLIRSHVAKGKNAGKTGRQTRRQHQGQIVRSLAPIWASKRLDREHEEQEATSGEVHPQLNLQGCKTLPGVSFPADLTESSRNLLRRYFSYFKGPIFPTELCDDVGYNFSGSLWIQLIFFDEIYLHCSVALSSAAVGCIDRQGEESTETAAHLARIFRLLNDRLSGEDALSDSTIASVVALTLYERFTRRYRQGMVHFEGLQRLVDLRGGISRLGRTQSAISQKVFRADLEFALQMGSPTRYNATDTFGHAVFVQLRRRFDRVTSPQLAISPMLQAVGAELQEALLDVLSFAWSLNGGSGTGIKLRSIDFHNSLIYLGYRLVQVRPLRRLEPITSTETILQLGLLCFVVHFLVDLNRKVPQFELLSRMTRLATQDQFPVQEMEQELLLWTLFMARCSIFSPMDDDWLISRLKAVVNALGLHEWQHARRILSKFPWIDGFSDRSGEALWKHLAWRTGSEPYSIACSQVE